MFHQSPLDESACSSFVQLARSRGSLVGFKSSDLLEVLLDPGQLQKNRMLFRIGTVKA